MGNADRGNNGAEAAGRRRTLETLSVAARHEVERFLLIRYDIDIIAGGPTGWLDGGIDARLHEIDDPARPWELELPSFLVSGQSVRLGVDDAGYLYAGADPANVITSRRELIDHLQQLDRGAPVLPPPHRKRPNGGDAHTIRLVRDTSGEPGPSGAHR